MQQETTNTDISVEKFKELGIECGNIVETIFLPNDFNKIEDWEDTFNFCVDVKGRTRKGSGIVSMDEKDDDDLRFVPSDRYDISCSAWNSHQMYVEIQLPNPATDLTQYQKIRKTFTKEITKRVTRLLKKVAKIKD